MCEEKERKAREQKKKRPPELRKEKLKLTNEKKKTECKGRGKKEIDINKKIVYTGQEYQ